MGMNPLKIAVIGAGVSGVVAAHYLAKKHSVVLFEAEDRLGGHTNTIDIPERPEFGADAGLPVDTGFIVYNDRTYPNFIRFLTELGIKGAPTEMSFSYYDQARDRAYAGTNLAGLFACRSNLVSPGFWTFLASVGRFNLRAAKDLKRGGLEGIGLEEYLRRIKAPARLKSDYLGPMTQAIWSVPEDDAMAYPAATFLRFFDNHGLLSVPGRITWRYLKGGSRTYLEAFQAKFTGEIRLGAPVEAVERPAEGMPLVHFKDGSQIFDAVVIAAHADQALAMLPDADERERYILGPWRYSRNRTVLHCDQRHMPPLKKAWACWNVSRLAGDDEKIPVRVTYWMNLLQRLEAENNWLVSLNTGQEFAPGNQVYETLYEHPVFTLESVAAQKELPAISGRRRTYFCGAYHGYGFHEDGAKSAVEVVRKHFGVEP
jgi:predicted NAD/FAD-binding protein